MSAEAFSASSVLPLTKTKTLLLSLSPHTDGGRPAGEQPLDGARRIWKAGVGAYQRRWASRDHRPAGDPLQHGQEPLLVRVLKCIHVFFLLLCHVSAACDLLLRCFVLFCFIFPLSS